MHLWRLVDSSDRARPGFSPHVVLVLDLDRQVLGHLVVALTRHRRQLRAEGIAEPAGLAELLALATERAKAGQSGTPLAGMAAAVDAGVDDVAPLLVDRTCAARVLGVSVRTLSRLVARGDLRPVDVAGCRRYRVADLEHLAAGDAV